jgi:hypothetical protein
MTRKDSNKTVSEIKAMMAEDGDFLRPIVRTVIQGSWKPRWPKQLGRKRENESKSA